MPFFGLYEINYSLNQLFFKFGSLKIISFSESLHNIFNYY